MKVKVSQVELFMGGSRGGDCKLDLAGGRRGADRGGGEDGGGGQRGDCLHVGLESKEFDCWAGGCGQLQWSGRVSIHLFWKVRQS